MPDHLHLLWMGLRVNSDQRNAMKFCANIWPWNWRGARRRAWNLNCKNNRTTACCGKMTAFAARLKSPAFTSSTTRAGKSWWIVRATGRIWAPSCRVIHFCIRWPMISGSSSGNYTCSNLNRCRRSGSSAESRKISLFSDGGALPRRRKPNRNRGSATELWSSHPRWSPNIWACCAGRVW